MSISNQAEQVLDERIHDFLERKLKRYPELAALADGQERSGLMVKFQANVASWFHPSPRRAHEQ